MAKYSALPEQLDPFRPHSFLSQATMYWSRKYLVASNQLTEEYIAGLPRPVDLDGYADKLEQAWEKEIAKAQPSFFRALASVFWRKYLIYMIPFLLKTVGQVVIAVSITLLTESLRDDSSLTRMLELALLYSLASLLTVCAVNQGFFRASILGAMLRTTVFSVLYRKALSLSVRDLSSNRVSARFTNLVASELDQFEYLSSTWYLIITPLFVVISTPVVYWLIGYAGLAGVCLVLVYLPVKSYLSKFVEHFYSHSNTLKEQRLKATQTLTEGIKPIKMYSWEDDLIAAIEKMRRSEYRQQCNMNIHRNTMTTFFFSGGAILMLLTLVIYTALGNDIEAGSMFGAMGILLTMNNWVTGLMSFGFDMCAWYKTIFARLTEFMSLPEQMEQRLIQPACADPSVVCEDVYASWTSPEAMPSNADQVELSTRASRDGHSPSRSVLQSLNLTVRRGELVIFVGVLGAGKSSLLSTLSGDLVINEGIVKISSSVAYVTQDPWIMCGTVRENILMGQAFEEARYSGVVEMCGLLTDFEQMPKSDSTMIGDSGSTLSGGQKARIALARAVYQGKEVYLLDDPLSAVDAQVGLHIFRECIVKGLSGATRLLVTHHHHLLPHADRVVIMHEGRVLLQGTYSEVQNSAELQSVLSAYSREQGQSSRPQSSAGGKGFEDIEYQHVIEEEEELAGVPLRVYIQYLLLFFRSRWALLALGLVMALLQVVSLASSYWVSYWAVQSPEAQKDPWFAWVLTAIVALLVVISIVRNFFVLEGLNLCNQRLHLKALEGVVRTDLSFFDKNPSGRIMSRFTKDVSLVEFVMLKYFSDLLMLTLMLVSYAIALVVTTPANLIALLVLIFLAVKLSGKLVVPSRQLKRKELTTKADLVTLVTSTIAGVATIHSLDLTSRFIARFGRAADINFKTWFCFFVSARTFQVINDYLGMVFLSFNAFMCVLLKGSVPADVLAVGFSFTVLVISYLGWFGDVYINVGNQMISVHRLYQYTQLPREKDPYPNQPLLVTKGKVEFQQVCLRYAPHLDLSLRNLTFTVFGGSKAGVVGRTGAGKSSMLLALFRLKELESGYIVIDGQNIAEVSLKSLRSQISVIPQSPLLFHGDLRINVDPTKSYSSAQVDTILQDLRLFNEADTDARQLSAGQKQLLCLSRAMLRDSQILICDEATGSIDPKTEDFVQSFMQQRLSSKTIITIAHRLKTVMQCDLVLVLDAGRCVESGSPKELAQQNSYFSRLLQASQTEL